MPTRRQWMLAAASASAPLSGAWAQDGLSKPIRFIVPLSAGTGTGLLTQPRMAECMALCTARGLDVTMADAAAACK